MRPEHAIGVAAVALEVQHGVHRVLEHARAGDRAVLGDVPDEQRGRPAALGPLDQARSDLAHLRHAARDGVEVGRVQRLHRVDREHLGAEAVGGLQRVRDGRVGAQEQPGREGREALAAQPDLRA